MIVRYSIKEQKRSTPAVRLKGRSATPEWLFGTRAAVGGGEKAARRIANALAKWLVGTALAQDAAREKLLADEADHAWPPNF